MCPRQPWRMPVARRTAFAAASSSGSANHFAMSSVSRTARVYGVAMTDDRRRQLREDELARIASAIDPRARAVQSAPLLGGLDAATYALDLDVAVERRQLVGRIFTLPG